MGAIVLLLGRFWRFFRAGGMGWTKNDQEKDQEKVAVLPKESFNMVPLVWDENSGNLPFFPMFYLF
jgi:hypothetical protein